MAPKTAFLISALAFAGLVQPCQGNAFLKKQDMPSLPQFLNGSAIEATVREIRRLKGKEAMDAQMPAIKAALEPMWKSMPTQQGLLDNGQVKYALHRYFEQRHGWHIDGLDITSVPTDDSKVARQQVPSFLIDIFHKAFGKNGLAFNEVATVAATLEHLIHDEASDRLKDVYKALSLSPGTPLTQAQVDEAVKAYMMSLLLGQDKLSSEHSLQAMFGKLDRTYPGWKDMQMWLQDVRETVSYMQQGTQNPFAAESGYSFKQVENIVETVSQRMGSYQDKECRELKDLLLESEDGNSGRVRLSDFYQKGMETNLQFVEKVEYLRQLGALDESLPGEPRVIVPNYILSQGSCLAEMGYYSICCINECESLMGHLERDIAAPEATPEKIARVISNYSTSSTEAPGQFSEAMMRKLNQVALRNGGSVPLHSRLFAQWLHYAFPRECPFPHTAGSTNPLTPAEWMEVNEAKPNMKLNDMRAYIASVKDSAQSEEENKEAGISSEEEEALLMRWSEEETLLYVPAAEKFAASGFWRVVLSFVMMGGFVVLLVDQAKRTGGLETLGIKEKSHMV